MLKVEYACPYCGTTIAGEGLGRRGCPSCLLPSTPVAGENFDAALTRAHTAIGKWLALVDELTRTEVGNREDRTRALGAVFELENASERLAIMAGDLRDCLK